MEIIQVIIFMTIVVAAIVQQTSKAGKRKKTLSPKEVLADTFPVSPDQTVHKPQTPRMPHRPTMRKPAVSPREENKKEGRTPIRLSTKEEARRAFIYSEIFNRKYQ